MKKLKTLVFLLLFAFTVLVAGQAAAELPPIPLPEPDSVYPNIFYGAVPTPVHLPAGVGETAPVLVFVHGLHGTAMNWWIDNDMYEMAYWEGYRTAFVSLNPDNSPNSESIETNAAVLQELLPHIAAHFNTSKMYLIGHSKGGVDIQAAMLATETADLVKAVFTISSPNQGTELADWAFENPELAGPLNLLSPGVESLKTDNMAQFRSLADPILKRDGIPFYYISGTKFTGNPVTAVTGVILLSLTSGNTINSLNDGLVTVARTKLSDEYAWNLGTVPFNHFTTDSGSVTFHKIAGRIQGLEFDLDEFNKIAASGFSEFGGDIHNTWIWSMKWFKGKLYVGTGREVDCVSFLISDVNTNTQVYPAQVQAGNCPDYSTLIQNLGAEIWRYTPETENWERVFKSPNTIPVAFDQNGIPTAFTARDIGFRGMEVHEEKDGTAALYVGGATSGSIFDPIPFDPNSSYPPPRLLRSEDGTNWTPVPQEPGTFLGEIGNVLADPEAKFRSFRSLKSYKGKLFATISDFIGSGVILVSEYPSAGNNAWQQASPPRSEFPVWTLAVFNDYLYATTGLTQQQDVTLPGYGVYKTDAEGSPPYNFIPVVVNGGYQSDPDFRSPNGLSFGEFGGLLYLGTNRPTEMIRMYKDDSWELVVGEPRDTPDGYKAPISGFGNGFTNGFIGHFWRFGSYNDNLYLGTWDWSALLQGLPSLEPLDRLFTAQYGFELLRTEDGIHWTAITRTGMGVPYNTGARSLEATPFGLFMGTAGENSHGGEIYQTWGACGVSEPPAPERLTAASESVVGRTVKLSWEPSPHAVRYRVYRSISIPLIDVLSGVTLTFPLPDGTTITVTIEEIQAGALDFLCAGTVGDTTLCAAVQIIKHLMNQVDPTAGPHVFPLGFKLIDIVTGTNFEEPAPNDLQSTYFVRAEDQWGNVSDQSNFVGAPSKAVPVPARIKAGEPYHVWKGSGPWESQGRIVGLAEGSTDFTVTVLNSAKEVVKTAQSEWLKEGLRAYDVWLEPGTYIILITAEGYEPLDLHGLEVMAGYDLRIDLAFGEE